jgi:alpha-1,2-mannosyltransferase
LLVCEVGLQNEVVIDRGNAKTPSGGWDNMIRPVQMDNAASARTSILRACVGGGITRLLVAGFLSLAFAVAVLTVIGIVRNQWHDGPYQVSSITHGMPEADYSNLWAAGKIAAAGHSETLYDGQNFVAWRQRTFGDGIERLDWLYPPPMVALGLVVTRLPLLPGYFLWILVTSSLSVWALRGAGLSWSVVLFGLFGPPTWRGMILGQYAPMAAAFSVAALLQAGRAPIRAGLAVAFVTLKPQLGSLIPVVWIAQRRWAALVAASLGTLSIAAASTAALGVGIWPAFLVGSSVSGRALLETVFPGGYPVNGASVYWMARSFGLPLVICYVAQIATAVIAAGLAWTAARRRSETGAAAFTVCMTLLVSPYLYASDLVAYSIVVAMLAIRRGNFVSLPVLLWLCPGISEVFAVLTGKVLLPVPVVVAAVLCWRAFDTPTSTERTPCECATGGL